MYKISFGTGKFSQQKDHKEDITIFGIISHHVIFDRGSECLRQGEEKTLYELSCYNGLSKWWHDPIVLKSDLKNIVLEEIIIEQKINVAGA